MINQVTKRPLLADQHEVATTDDGPDGTDGYKRVTGDFNFKTGEDAAVRLNAKRHVADNKGAEIDKYGVAPRFSCGIGTRDKFNWLGVQYAVLVGVDAAIKEAERFAVFGAVGTNFDKVDTLDEAGNALLR